LIYAIMEYARFSGDREFVERHYERIISALKFLDRMRDRTLAPDYMAATAAPERFRGILPPSYSHEGYNPPMHSYWDDFWALRAWEDGAAAARLLGRTDDALWAESRRGVWRDSIRASIAATMRATGVDYIPGCADKGDFDATSTAIGVFPCNATDAMPPGALAATFARYTAGLDSRRAPGWDGVYTPYEVRSVQVLDIIGQQADAHKLLDFLMLDRRPAPWRHFAEVVLGDYRKGAYIGDMPHTWVGAGYVNSLRGLLVREAPDALELLPGVPAAWLAGDGILIRNLPTHHGPIDLTAAQSPDGKTLTVTIGGAPTTSLHLHWPAAQRPASVTVDGQAIAGYGDASCLLPAAARSVVVRW
jgi:hypothetical protein